MLTRLNRRNVLDASLDPGRFGGRYHDDESGCEVVYRVKRLPVGLASRRWPGTSRVRSASAAACSRCRR